MKIKNRRTDITILLMSFLLIKRHIHKLTTMKQERDVITHLTVFISC
jgi:hypothetical protein